MRTWYVMVVTHPSRRKINIITQLGRSLAPERRLGLASLSQACAK